MRTPATAFRDDPKTDPPIPPEPEGQLLKIRMQIHRVAVKGKVTVDYKHIHLGAEYGGTTVLALHDGDQISVFTTDGTLIRTVTVQPGVRYYGNGNPRGRRLRRSQQAHQTRPGEQPAPPPKREGVKVERPQRSEDERP
jgi:hypothetical protein